MPLTIRIENYKTNSTGNKGFDFSSNKNEKFSSLIQTGSVLVGYQIAKKAGYGINAAVGAYTMDYKRQNQIQNVMNATDRIIGITTTAALFLAGNLPLSLMSIGKTIYDTASTFFYDAINVRNANFQATYLQTIVGTTRKENGRIGF